MYVIGYVNVVHKVLLNIWKKWLIDLASEGRGVSMISWLLHRQRTG